MTVIFVEVNSVSYNKDILHIGSKIVCPHLYLSPGLFIQKGANLDRAGVLKCQPVLQELECPAAVNDILDDEDILFLNGNFDVLGDLDIAGGFHPGPIAGQADEINLDRNPEMPDQVGKKHEGPFQDADQHQFPSTIILRDLIGQMLDDGGDLFLREQWIKTIFFHTIY